MKPQALWRVSVTTALEAEEAVVELLARLFGQPPAVCGEVGTGRITAMVYLARRSDWTRGKRDKLQAGLRYMRACGLSVGPGRISLRRLRPEDWAESWKRHFKPLEIGQQILIKPSWSQRQPHPGQAVVLLDPGLSFGTGQHPTTRFCLEQLVALKRPAIPQSFLDVGTGSGILAMAAAKLGYSPVEAFDSDRDCVRVARANARLNSVADQIRILHRDLTRATGHRGRRFDVICANLTADLLVAQRRRIIRELRPSGTLVLAGVLASEFSSVCQAYEGEGLRLTRHWAELEWASGTFSHAAGPST
jgi:ribosomal protein L11 methyltransferase